MLSYDDYAVLAEILGLTDSLWEPRRACPKHSGSSHAAIRSRAAVDQMRADYDAEGLSFLPPDRTAQGRQATAATLADLASQGLLEVRARSGRAAHVKLTMAGDHLARRVCGLPTRDSSAGFLVRLVEQLDKPGHPRRWKRNGCLSEAAMIYPAGETGTKVKRKNGIGELLACLAPWLPFKHVLSHETTRGCAWFELTDVGREHYQTLELAEGERDWLLAWDAETETTNAQYGVTEEQQAELNRIVNDTFTARRAELLRATPKLLSELGELAWPATQ